MCIFSHVAVGALVGALSPAPFVAPLFAMGSHVLMDMVPHYDFEGVFLEVLFTSVAVVVLAVGGVLVNTGVVLGMLFAVAPDIENLLWRLGKISDDKKIFPGHTKGFARHGRVAGKSSLFFQFALSATVLFYLVWSVS